MTAQNLQNLITTITKLECLSHIQVGELLEKMRFALGTKHAVMSLNDFNTIIGFLSNFIKTGMVGILTPRLLEFDCYDLEKTINNIPRSLAIVQEHASNEAVLYILTDRKHYIFTQTKNGDDKYHADDPLSKLGNGSNKSVKVCITIQFKDGKFIVGTAAKATVRLCELSLGSVDDKYYNPEPLRVALQDAISIQNTLGILSECEPFYNELCNNFIATCEEVRLSKSLCGKAGIQPLSLGVPFIKTNKKGEQWALMHVFNKKFDGSLSKIIIPNEKLMSVVEQMLHGLLDIHKREVLHRDIKVDNILASIVDDKPQISFIDFGSSIDFKKLKSDTLSLLFLLGFDTSNADGLIEGRWLDRTGLNYALFLLETEQISTPNQRDNTAPTLLLIKNKLIEYVNWGQVKFMRLYATLGFDSPEVFADVGRLYYEGLDNYRSLGRAIYNSLSVKAKDKINTQVDHKHDVWALGITIVCLFLDEIPDLHCTETIAFIEANALLRDMLHPNPIYRVNAEQALTIYNISPTLFIPEIKTHAELCGNYENKITCYNDYLESEAFEFSAVYTAIKNHIGSINKVQSAKELNFIIDDLTHLFVRRMSDLEQIQKSYLGTLLLKELMTEIDVIYRVNDAAYLDKLILLILNSDVDINSDDLVHITHTIIANNLSIDLVDAVAIRIIAVKPPMDPALNLCGKNIWDASLGFMQNLGGHKINAFVRYIEKVVAVQPYKFMASIMQTSHKILEKNVTLLLLDNRLRNTLNIATNETVLEYLASSSVLSKSLVNNNFLVDALKTKRSWETQHENNHDIISDKDLSTIILSSLNQYKHLCNVPYYTMILYCFVPHLINVNSFCDGLKDVIDNLTKEKADLKPIIDHLNKMLSELPESDGHIKVKNYFKQLRDDMIESEPKSKRINKFNKF